MCFNLSQMDVLRYEVKKNLLGRRVKHFIEVDGVEIYNERDCGIVPNEFAGFGKLWVKPRGCGGFRAIGTNIGDASVPFGGAEDPRSFRLNEKVYVIFNRNNPEMPTSMHLYDVDSERCTRLWVSNDNNAAARQHQKNWVPYVLDGCLYFVYLFNRACVLRVIDVDTGECECIKGSTATTESVGPPSSIKYYGGTPLVRWKDDLYVGFGHTRRPWRAVPVLYDSSKMEVVRATGPISFSNPPEAVPWRGKSVQFPYDLQINEHAVRLCIEFEDRCPTWLHLDYEAFCRQFAV